MKHIILLLSFFALLIAGCSGNVSMGGRVTYSDTGEPVEFGTVVFSSPTKQSRGEIKANGKYVIGTRGDKDGLPRGEYSVTIYAVKSGSPEDDAKTGAASHITDSIRLAAPPPPGQSNPPSGQSKTKPKISKRPPTGIPLINPKYQNPATSGLKVVVDGKTKTFDIQVERAPKK